MSDHIPPILGWRERVALPRFGITSLKAKLDSGARSAALHVETLETFEHDGETWLRFVLRPGRRHPRRVQCEARAHARRAVTDSGGSVTERWFIETDVALAGLLFQTEISLTDRRDMLFPMLLGRTALAGRIIVDPARSYTCARNAASEKIA
ncbi:MAG: RimK/LysX family protein [Rhodanobacteraceae bacterium]|nr:RimK/LysX family protein [Pseudomonadota bacterium]